MDDCSCVQHAGVGIGVIVAIFALLIGVPLILHNWKDMKFRVATLLYLAFWIYIMDFSQWNTKQFLVRNLLLLAGLLVLKKIVWALKWTIYGLFTYFVVKTIKKMDIGKALWEQVEKIKETLKPTPPKK